VNKILSKHILKLILKMYFLFFFCS